MTTQELRAKTTDQLKDELVSLKKEQFNLRFQASTGELANLARFKQVRRLIARIKTVMNEKKKEA